MTRERFAVVVFALLATLMFAGCGQQELERMKAENIKIKEQNMRLEKELQGALAENAEMRAKLDRIQGILAPPAPAPEPQPDQDVPTPAKTPAEVGKAKPEAPPAEQAPGDQEQKSGEELSADQEEEKK